MSLINMKRFPPEELIMYGFVAAIILFGIYGYKAREAEDWRREAAFQEYLKDCRCEENGTAFAGEGEEICSGLMIPDALMGSKLLLDSEGFHHE